MVVEPAPKDLAATRKAALVLTINSRTLERWHARVAPRRLPVEDEAPELDEDDAYNSDDER